MPTITSGNVAPITNEDLDSKLNQLRQSVVDVGTKIDTSSRVLIGSSPNTASNTSLVDQVSAIATQVNSLSDIKTSFPNGITALQGKIQAVSDQVGTDNARKTDGTIKVTTIQDKATALSTQIGTLQGEISALQGDVQGITNQVGTDDVRNPDNTVKTSTIQGKVAALSTQIGGLQTDITALQDKFKIVSDQVGTDNTTNADNTLKISTIQDKTTAIATQIKALQDYITNQNDALLGKINAATADKIGSVTSQITKLSDDVKTKFNDLNTSLANPFPLAENWINTNPVDQLQKTLAKYCSMVSPELGQIKPFQVNPGADPLQDVGWLPYHPVGAPISLTAIAPVPGAALGNGLEAAITLPKTSTITFAWSFSVFDSTSVNTIGTTYTPARLASSPFDKFGDFQLLTGDLTSPFLQIVPFPPLGIGYGALQRTFIASLTITIWLPNGKPGIQLPRIDLATRLSSWASVFGSSDKTTDVKTVTLPPAVRSAQDGLTSTDPFHFRDLFRPSLNTSAPAIGKPSILQILPVDKTATTQQKLDSIVNGDPNMHIEAALDIGAPLNSIINSLVKSVTSLFNHSSGSDTVLPPPIINDALSVTSVLSKSLSIPIALDFKGQTIAKTFKPKDDDLLHPNVTTILGGANLAGQIPVGNLATMIQGGAEHIDIVPDNPSVGLLHGPLDNACGLSLQLLPEPRDISDTTRSTVNIAVRFRPNLTLPGAGGRTVQLDLDLGTITLQVPTFPIPQLAVFFHDRTFQSSGGELLISTDQTTSQYINSAEDAINAVKELSDVLNMIVRTIPLPRLSTPELKTKYDQLLNLLEIIALMRRSIRPDSKITMATPPTRSRWVYYLPPEWYKNDDSTGKEAVTNISSVLYLGTTTRSLNRLVLERDTDPKWWEFDSSLYKEWEFAGYIDMDGDMSPNVAVEDESNGRRSVTQQLSRWSNSFNDTVTKICWPPTDQPLPSIEKFSSIRVILTDISALLTFSPPTRNFEVGIDVFTASPLDPNRKAIARVPLRYPGVPLNLIGDMNITGGPFWFAVSGNVLSSPVNDTDFWYCNQNSNREAEFRWDTKAGQLYRTKMT